MRCTPYSAGSAPGWAPSFDADVRLAAALGYLAHVVERLGQYLGVPLRYPLHPCMSRSRIEDPAPPLWGVAAPAKAGAGSPGGEAAPMLPHPDLAFRRAAGGAGVEGSGGSMLWAGTLGGPQPPLTRSAASGSGGAGALAAAGPTLLPLFPEGRDRTRFAYAVYLLSKDLEQLLSAHELSSCGPGQPLQNLYMLVAAAAAALPCRGSGAGAASTVPA